MANEFTHFTGVSYEKFKCSARGLILPFSIEEYMAIPLRAVLYFIVLLYLFLGIAIITNKLMSSIETITSKKQKIRYPVPGEKDKYLTIQVRTWNATVANLTLMALGSSSLEILLPITEILCNRFEAGELGPGTVVGSAAYNLLIICALCISAIRSPETRRIKFYSLFMVTSFFGFFAYIWMFIVLSVISKDVVELWEAVITFLMFPLVVILAFLAEKNFFISANVPLEEEETKLTLTPPEHDESGNSQNFRKDELLQFYHSIGQRTNLSLEDKAQLFAAKVSESMNRSRMQNQIEDAQTLTGGKSLFVNLPDKLQEIYTDLSKRDAVGGLLKTGNDEEENIDPNDHRPLIEFSTTSYAILEREQRVELTVQRRGPIDVEFRFRLDTIDGTAIAGEDYIQLSEEFKMERGQQEKGITIHVIDDNQWGPDETFFVKLSLPEGEETRAKLGSKTIALVTIINDDEPGVIEFEEPITLVKESVGKAEIKLVRINGADERVSVHYRTRDTDDVVTKNYEPVQGEVIFEHGEISKIITIPIINDLEAEKDASFAVELYDPTGGASLGKHTKTVVTIINDDDYKAMADRMASLVQADMNKLNLTKTTWGQQFQDAITVNRGDLETAKFGHYIGHVLTFLWKILFAFVPPTVIAGGWLTFFVSLIFIVILTVIVRDVAVIFGCLVGLKDIITAIILIALVRSLPNTFSSMIVAKTSKTADDAIGNVMESNSVKVFLGIGLSWLVAACYWEWQNLPFTVKSGNLSFSVLVFSICCILAMTVLILRRYLSIFGKAELGGPTIPKYICSIFFVLLWIGYLTLSVLQAYGYIKWQR